MAPPKTSPARSVHPGWCVHSPFPPTPLLGRGRGWHMEVLADVRPPRTREAVVSGLLGPAASQPRDLDKDALWASVPTSVSQPVRTAGALGLLCAEL